MALYSKKEFANKCGISTNALSVYIKRGKVVLTEDNNVDESIPQNQVFIAKHYVKFTVSEIEPSKSGKVKLPKEVSKSLTLDLARKEIENERATLSKHLLQQKLGRQRGEMIPFEDVKAALDQHFRDLTVFFTQGCRNLLVEIALKAKWNINQKAELNKSLERIVNDSVNRSVDATIATLRKIQKDTSAKREVGEKAS